MNNSTVAPTSRGRHTLTAFVGLLQRDFRVLRREIGPFVVRIIMQPLLFLFVFTYVFPHMNQGANPMASAGGVNLGTVLLPGLMAVAIMFTGIAAVALPLSQEFGNTREIDDRVMCPLPVAFVALEKVCFSAMQSILGALLVLPLAYYIPSVPVQAHVSSWWLFAVVLILASLVAGALGLAIGANVKPQQIGLIFSIVVIPITFLGCVYYPWAYLNHMRWLQIAVLFNPIVYMSEGLRAALTPGVSHMPYAYILLALVVSFGILGKIGLNGFMKRVISQWVLLHPASRSTDGLKSATNLSAAEAALQEIGLWRDSSPALQPEIKTFGPPATTKAPPFSDNEG